MPLSKKKEKSNRTVPSFFHFAYSDAFLENAVERITRGMCHVRTERHSRKRARELFAAVRIFSQEEKMDIPRLTVTRTYDLLQEKKGRRKMKNKRVTGKRVFVYLSFFSVFWQGNK